MGLIGKLLAAPLVGPAVLGPWLLDQVIAAAEAELYDPDRIVLHLRELAREFEEGRLTEDEHAAAEAVLLERLMEARAMDHPHTEES